MRGRGAACGEPAPRDQRQDGRGTWGPRRVALAGLLVMAVAAEAATAPVLIQNAAGRFEVAAVDPTAAHAVAAAADEVWRLLAAPLGLPDGFSSPVFVR